MNVVFVRVGAIGDVIMTTPAIAAASTHYKSKIDFVVGEWSADVLANNPAINKVIVFPDSWVFQKNILRMYGLARQLRKYDVAFFFDKSWHWSLFAKATHIPQRYGFARGKEGFGYHTTTPFTGNKAEYQSNLDLTALAGILPPSSPNYNLYPSESDQQAAEHFLKQLGINQFICIAPGGANNPGHTFLEKRWPKQRYVELINNLPYTTILLGGKQDVELCGSIAQQTKAIVAAGKLNLLASVSLLSKSKLMITHDSGPMHLASAAGTKILALFGPTPPRRFAPPNAEIIYPYKGQPDGYDSKANISVVHTMETIMVADVLAKAKEML